MLDNSAAGADKLSVTIGNEAYRLTEAPKATATLVTAAKAGILDSVQLDDFLIDLRLVGQLLFVAYNGVATQPQLRGQISKLQSDYMRLCGDSEMVMYSFEKSSQAMLRHLSGLFVYLFNGDEDTALIYLNEMAEVAEQMAAEAARLADGFSRLFEQAQAALVGAEGAKVAEEAKKHALEKEKLDFEAKLEAAKTLRDEIEKSKLELQRLYQEAKEKAEKAEDRAFALAIVGAIFSAVGTGLAAYAGAQTGGTLPRRGAADASAEAPKADDAKAPSSKERIEADAALTRLKADLDAAESELKVASAQATEAKDEAEKAKKAADEKVTEDEKAAREDALKEAQDKAGKAAQAAREAERKAEDARQAVAKAEARSKLLKGLGAGAGQGGQAAEDMGHGYSEIAAAYNKERQTLLSKLLEEGKNEREALAAIAEYAKRMEGIGSLVNFSDLVIEALHQALGALKAIIVILETASELWTRMARHCKALASESGEFRKKIELWKLRPNRVELYRGDLMFKEGAVRHYCNWKALEVVSGEYNAAVKKIKKEVQGNVMSNLRTDEMLKLAVSEGKKLLDQTRQQMGKLDAELKHIEQEMQGQDIASA